MTKHIKQKSIKPIAAVVGGVIAGAGLAIAGAIALKNKKVGIIITGAGDFKSSAKNAVDYLKRVCKIYKMGVVGVVFGKADKAEEISKNSEAILQAKKLGKELSQQ